MKLEEMVRFVLDLVVIMVTVLAFAVVLVGVNWVTH